PLCVLPPSFISRTFARSWRPAVGRVVLVERGDRAVDLFDGLLASKAVAPPVSKPRATADLVLEQTEERWLWWRLGRGPPHRRPLLSLSHALPLSRRDALIQPLQDRFIYELRRRVERESKRNERRGDPIDRERRLHCQIFHDMAGRCARGIVRIGG